MTRPKTYSIPGHLDPPGCLEQYLVNPHNWGKTIELALFNEHRFAFYYWLKWTNELAGEIPSLVTYDWHQDLAPPYNDERPGLQALDTEDKGDVAFYSWARLSHFNDVQIQAACLHNKIKDVYAICRQQTSRKQPMIITDFEGHEHRVFIFKDPEEFEAHLPQIHDRKVYFDIDLDYFTLGNPTSMGSPYSNKRYTYLSKEEMLHCFSVSNPCIRWIMDRIAGFTIAAEPEFCGGKKKSDALFRFLENLYFTSPLFHRDLTSGGPEWKHAPRPKY